QELAQRGTIYVPRQAVHAQAARRRGKKDSNVVAGLDATGQRQDQNDDQNHAENTGRALTPAGAIPHRGKAPIKARISNITRMVLSMVRPNRLLMRPDAHLCKIPATTI